MSQTVIIRQNFDSLPLIDKLAALHDFELVQIASGELLFDQNKYLHHVFVVKSGIAKVYMTVKGGEMFIQEFFGPGEIAGEIEALERSPTFCAVRAVEPLVFYRIPVETFRELVDTNQEFNSWLLSRLACKIKYKASRHSMQHTETLADNLFALQKDYPDILNKISKSDLANYLGVSLRSLNRVLANI